MNSLWYHCGRCGSLFESDFGFDESRVCTLCERKPGIGVWPVGEKSAVDSKPDAKAFDKMGEVLIEDTGRRAVRKKRRANTMMKVVIVWTFLMLLAVWLRYHYTRVETDEKKLDRVASNMTKGTLADERIALLNKALPDCHRALGGFLSAGSPELRNQFVVNPIETAGKMATYYSRNPFPKMDVTRLHRTGQEIIQVGEEWMIKTRWKEQDGLEFDALFRRDSGTWRLDWKHFNCYSEYPWTLFLSGEGPAEADFRLLARRRLVTSESEKTGSRLTFTMFAPEFGKASEFGMESPDFVINRRSDEGLLIDAAFAARENGETLFGQVMKPLEDSDIIRLQVRVKRSELGGKRTFTLEKVIACHWIDTELPGFELNELKDDLFGH